MKNLNKNFDFIMCDSKKALKRYKNKLNLEKILIKTSSPSILIDKKFKTEHLEKKWSSKNFLVFQNSIYLSTKQCFNLLNKEEDLSKQEKLFFLTVFADFHRFLYKASCLNNSFLNKNILLITMSPQAKLAGSINPPWETLLKDKANIHKIEYVPEDFSLHESINKNTEKADLLSRLYLGGFETFVYRIFIYIYTKFPFLNKKKIFILAENELLIEKSFEFITNNYALIKILDLIPKNEKANGIKKIDKTISLTKCLVEKTISKYVNKNFHDVTYKYFLKDIKNKFNLYYQYLYIYRNYIQDFKNINYKKSFLFMSTPSTMKPLACSQAFQEKKIKSVAFQHGVTAEISGTHKFNRVFHSSSNGDFFAAFNNSSADIAKKNIFSNSRSIIFGLPKRYKRQKLFFKKNKIANSLIYLSNNLYKGNFGNLSQQCTDFDILKREINLTKKVLIKTNKKVFFKTYPTINPRYDDADPIQDYLNDNSIDIIHNKIDARYLLKKYCLILCGSASSTLSWAVFSQNPIIFINYSDRAPLSKNVYQLFKKSFFCFNYNKKNFHKSLLDFINLPLKEINMLWASKNKNRKHFISEFISTENNIKLINFLEES